MAAGPLVILALLSHVSPHWAGRPLAAHQHRASPAVLRATELRGESAVVEELLYKLRNSTTGTDGAVGEAEAEALRAILSARAGAAGSGDAGFASADGAVAADGDGLRSSALRGATAAVFELRSYVQGLRSEVEVLRDRASDKARKDFELALAAADYLARRVIIDSGALLSAAGAAASSSLRLGAAPLPPPKETAAPFAARADKVERTLAASAAELGEARSGGLALAAEARSFLSGEDVAEERWRERAESIVAEAAYLARDGWSAAERQVWGWLAGVRDRAAPAPSAEAVQMRTRTLGSLCAAAFGDAAAAAARATRADAAAYAALRQTGRLPTLLEEVVAVAPVLMQGGSWLASLPPSQVLAPVRAILGDGRLGAFDLQESPTAQLTARTRRRDREGAWRQLALAGAVAGRASKDSTDLLVVGMLPAVRAAGRVAVRRVTDGGLASGLVRELAAALREEYASTAGQVRARSAMGAAAGEAMQQTTRRISRSVASATAFLSLEAAAVLPSALLGAARGEAVRADSGGWAADGAGAALSQSREFFAQWGTSGVIVPVASSDRVSALRASETNPFGALALLEWPMGADVAPVPRAPVMERPPWAGAAWPVAAPASWDGGVGWASADVLDVSAVVEEEDGTPDRLLALLDASLYAAEVLVERMTAVAVVVVAEARGEREWTLLPTAFCTAERVRVRREKEASRRLLDALAAAIWRV